MEARCSLESLSSVGTLAEVKPMAGGYRVRIETSLADETQPGDSVAVDGVCLTALVAAIRAKCTPTSGPRRRASPRSAALARGQRVNLERPMRADAGSAATSCSVTSTALASSTTCAPKAAATGSPSAIRRALAALFIRKGCVAVDGVSLTVAGLDDRRFDVQVIPYTWAHTTLGAAEIRRQGEHRVRRARQVRRARRRRSPAWPSPAPLRRALMTKTRHGSSRRHPAAPARRAAARPDRSAPVEDAVDAIGRGGMVIVVDDEDRENEGDLTIAAEKVTPEVDQLHDDRTAAGSSACR